jgi:protein-S-isoprenylcysteine O-methyltransferase Ste14
VNALETRIPPPLVFIATAALMWLLARWTVVLDVPPLARYAAAALPFIGALITAPFAIASFRRAQTTVDPVHVDRSTSLVIDGPFAYTRNPMYLGLALLLLAWAVILSAPWALLGPLAFALYITRFQIIPEERAMAAKFGAAYESYRRRVRRWI